MCDVIREERDVTSSPAGPPRSKTAKLVNISRDSSIHTNKNREISIYYRKFYGLPFLIRASRAMQLENYLHGTVSDKIRVKV